MDEHEVRAALKDIDALQTYEERAQARLKLCDEMEAMRWVKKIV